jgi:hypothetical protein
VAPSSERRNCALPFRRERAPEPGERSFAGADFFGDRRPAAAPPAEQIGNP